QLVRRLGTERLDSSGGPADHQGIDLRFAAQPEVQPRIARRFEAAVAANFRLLRQRAGLQLHARAEAIPVRFASNQLHFNPVTTGSLVAKQHWRSIKSRYDQIFGTAIQEVSRRRAAGDVLALKAGSRAHSNLFKLAVCEIAEQQWALSVSDAERLLIDLR